MARQAFDRKLESVATLSPDALVRALGDANNLYVSKVAKRIRELELTGCADSLVAAFDRFLINGPETDSQCWAKLELIRTIHAVGHRDAAVYLRAFHCVQLEAVWGGKADTAAAIRTFAAMALLETNLPIPDMLRELVGGLFDAAHLVRMESITALATINRWEAELVLRQKMLAGDERIEVTGAAMFALVELNEPGAIELVTTQLSHSNHDVALEAYAALAQCRHAQAFAVIRDQWKQKLDNDTRRTILFALGASPREEAVEFLLRVLEHESLALAGCAISALGKSRFKNEIRDRVAGLVDQRHDRELARLFREEYA